MAYTNSPLVSYTRLAPRSNHYGTRNHTIDRITPHCVATEWSIEQIGACFANPNRRASCNYGIGKDGRIGIICEEKTASGCSSNQANDERAITIECSSASTAPYAFRSVVYERLIDLCTDICKRNGKKKLLWIANKNTALAYKPSSDEMVLTVHRWFSAKACPGDWLMARMGDLAAQVTKRLGASSSASSSSASSSTSEKTKTIKATGVAKKYNKALSGVYVTTDSLNVRNDAGVGSRLLGTLPKGTRVQCYGYYSLSGVYKWAYVVANVGNTQYVGFVSYAYLRKV